MILIQTILIHRIQKECLSVIIITKGSLLIHYINLNFKNIQTVINLMLSFMIALYL